MSTKLSTGARNGVLGNTGISEMFTGGVVMIYSGPQPVSADAAATGTLLGVVSENGAAWIAGNPANGIRFKAPDAGVLVKVDDQWRMTGLAKGNAGWWRMVGNADDDGAASTTLPRIDGSLSAGGSGELKLSSTAIDVGVPVTVDRCIIRQPG